MSLNVHCHLVIGATRTELSLCQLTTAESEAIVYHRGDKRPWRESALLYIATITARNQPRRGESRWEREDRRDGTKNARRVIGRAWRAADEGGGHLEFSRW